MVDAMSGEPTPNGDAAAAAETTAGEGVENGAGNGASPDTSQTSQNGAVAEPAPAAANPAAELEARLAGLEKEKKDNWDRYLRAAADLENLRKRQKREVDDAKLESKGKVLKEMLPVVDNLERAIEHATATAGANPIVEGVQLVLRQFLTAFERLEVTPVEAEGKPFDPNLHEAISQAESDAAPGTVVQVLQRGYKSGDRLLRPALVVVAKAKSAPAE
jgi:molecular chaperone GrpE